MSAALSQMLMCVLWYAVFSGGRLLFAHSPCALKPRVHAALVRSPHHDAVLLLHCAARSRAGVAIDGEDLAVLLKAHRHSAQSRSAAVLALHVSARANRAAEVEKSSAAKRDEEALLLQI
jgi:hypothetical protein